MSLSSVGIWARGRQIIKHLRSGIFWPNTIHSHFFHDARSVFCRGLREAWSDSDDSMINAHLRSHSHTNFTQHSLSGWKRSWRKLPAGPTKSGQCSSKDKIDKMQFDVELWTLRRFSLSFQCWGGGNCPPWCPHVWKNAPMVNETW